MNWTEIAIAVATSGLITAVVTGFLNRRVTRAQARQTEQQANATSVDYAGVIIEQANKRVEQAFADTGRMREERDRWQEECRGQRKAKQEWRIKCQELTAHNHELTLAAKDTEAKLRESEWYRCETTGCTHRMPPRTETEQLKNRKNEKTV